MNTYALITYSDGTFLVREEYSTKDAAIIGYDNLHAGLINDKNCQRAVIKLLDADLNVVDNKYFDIITHAAPVKAEAKKSSK